MEITNIIAELNRLGIIYFDSMEELTTRDLFTALDVIEQDMKDNPNETLKQRLNEIKKQKAIRRFKKGVSE